MILRPNKKTDNAVIAVQLSPDGVHLVSTGADGAVEAVRGNMLLIGKPLRADGSRWNSMKGTS
jgi:hypothetical protein